MLRPSPPLFLFFRTKRVSLILCVTAYNHSCVPSFHEIFHPHFSLAFNTEIIDIHCLSNSLQLIRQPTIFFSFFVPSIINSTIAVKSEFLLYVTYEVRVCFPKKIKLSPSNSWEISEMFRKMSEMFQLPLEHTSKFINVHLKILLNNREIIPH